MSSLTSDSTGNSLRILLIGKIPEITQKEGERGRIKDWMSFSSLDFVVWWEKKTSKYEITSCMRRKELREHRVRSKLGVSVKKVMFEHS